MRTYSKLISTGLLLSVISSCYSPNIASTPIKDKAATNNLPATTNTQINNPVSSNIPKNPIDNKNDTNIAPTPLPIPSTVTSDIFLPSPSSNSSNSSSSGSSSSGSGFSSNTHGNVNPNTPEAIVATRKAELVNKLTNVIIGDKGKSKPQDKQKLLFILKVLAGFSDNDLLKLGYTQSEISSLTVSS